jgi:periplasmic protein TonB
MTPGAFSASLLLHMLLVAVLLVSIRGQRRPEEYVPPATVAMVFENGGAARTAAPKAARRGPPETPQAPARLAPPLPTPPRAPLVRPEPPAPLRPKPLPPAPAPPAPSVEPQQYSVRLPSPSEAQALLLRPPPVPTAPPRPAQPPAPRPAPPLPHYVMMNNMSFGRRPPAEPPPASRGLNLSLNQSQVQDAFAHEITVEGKIGADWLAELTQWVDERKYYPEPAIQFGQQGSVLIRMVIDRDGAVQKVTLLDSSGSPFLDSAWLGLFRGAHVPPFPPGTKANQITIQATMHYILIN